MEIAKNSLITNNNKEISKKENKPKTIFDLIKSMESQFKIALPKHLNSERFVRVAITEIRKNPKLAKCSQASLLGALMTSAQLGLEVGVLGQAYLIPYKTECQFQISYKGMIELLRRSGTLKQIYSYTVYENDEFEMVYGLKRNLIHKPNLGDRGEPIGYYAVAELKDDSIAFEFMNKEEVLEHAKRFSKMFNSGAWKTDFDEMAKKTVIKKLLKYLPVSTEYLENTLKDEKKFEYNQDSKEVNEIDDNDILNDIVEAEEVDIETGEILENREEEINE